MYPTMIEWAVMGLRAHGWKKKGKKKTFFLTNFTVSSIFFHSDGSWLAYQLLLRSRSPCCYLLVLIRAHKSEPHISALSCFHLAKAWTSSPWCSQALSLPAIILYPLTLQVFVIAWNLNHFLQVLIQMKDNGQKPALVLLLSLGDLP